MSRIVRLIAIAVMPFAFAAQPASAQPPKGFQPPRGFQPPPRGGQGQGNVIEQIMPQLKQCTVSIKATTEDDAITGCGFLAYEQGLVITNAHILGMLDKSSRPPTKLEVRLLPGEPGQLNLSAKVLAVDRTNDLAILRLDGKLPNLPTLQPSYVVAETQKLYVLGIPGMEKVVKHTEMPIASLKSDNNVLEKIQFRVDVQNGNAGGIQTGNSGGPVVNANGEVVGVAVVMQSAAPINFAIPMSKVYALVLGTIDEFKAGEIFKKGEELRVPLTLSVLDPLKRIKEVRLDVWAGKPTDTFPTTSKKAVLPKDVTRQTQKLTLENEAATLELPLPKLAEGQVAWVQPVLAYAKDNRYLEPRQFDPSQSVERLPANLVVKLPDKQLRTVHVRALDVNGMERKTIEYDVVESLSADPRGALVKAAFASLNLSEHKGDAKKTVPEDVTLITKSPATYLLEPTGKLQKRFSAWVLMKTIGPQEKEMMVWAGSVFSAYESVVLALPNKQMMPGQTWQAVTPFLLENSSALPKGADAHMTADALDGFSTAGDVTVNYTYDGMRTRGGVAEAVISFEGRFKIVNKKKEMKETIGARTIGKFTFDPALGFISSIKMSRYLDGFDADSSLLRIDLTRVIGNPKNIDPGKTDEALLRLAKSYQLADVQAMLTKLAPVKIENERLFSFKDGTDGDKKIVGEVPGWLQERFGHFDPKAGTTEFSAENDGVIVMAVSPRFRSGGQIPSPGSGVFGNIRDPWYWDCVSRRELLAAGWQECGTLPILGGAWPLYFRNCKKGETFRVRTEKEMAPIIMK